MADICYELRTVYNPEVAAAMKQMGVATIRRPSKESVLHHRSRYDAVTYLWDREMAERALRWLAEQHDLAVRLYHGKYLEASVSTAYDKGGDPIRDARAVVRLRTPIPTRRRRRTLRLAK